MKTADVIVLGLGTAGSSTCMALAQRGFSVIGVDAFTPPHRRGSHHGRSRSVRRAYMEGTSYVPMAMKAWELWRRLEKDTGQELMITTGNLTIGPEDCPAVNGFMNSARACDIPHALLTGAEASVKWPELAIPDSFVAGLELNAGIVFPEKAISAFLSQAEKAGATLLFDQPVTGWTDTGKGIRVHTSRGTLGAGKLLISSGAWTRSLTGHLGLDLIPVRVPVHWFDVNPVTDYMPDKFPVNFWQVPSLDGHGFHEFYSLPVTEPGGGVKMAFHNGLLPCDPDDLINVPDIVELSNMSRMVKRYLPGLAHRPVTSEVCMYTMTPDKHFCLGLLPGSGNIAVAAFAGHGFKFAPVIGEILADVLFGQPPAFPLELFNPMRLINP